jgi:tetratricopeptide (TPR) repeat protein
VQGDLAKAAAHFETAVRYNPDFVLALLALASIRSRADHPSLYDPAQAVSLAERSCAMTRYADPAALEILSKIYATVGRLDEALRTAERALQIARVAQNTALAKQIESNLVIWKRNADRISQPESQGGESRTPSPPEP